MVVDLWHTKVGKDGCFKKTFSLFVNDGKNVLCPLIHHLRTPRAD